MSKSASDAGVSLQTKKINFLVDDESALCYIRRAREPVPLTAFWP